jgi:small-conductance mechanosensitive channel
MYLDTWGNVLTSSFQNLWYGVIAFVPNLLVSVIICLVGWLIGSVLGKWVAQLLRAVKMDNALREVGTDDLLAKAGFRLNVGAFIGGLIKWFVIIVFLVAALEVLGLSQVTEFLRMVVINYLPNVVAAVLILGVAALIADALQRVIAGSARAAGISSAGFLGGLVRWAVWIFAVLAALAQLGVAPRIIEILITGVVAMLALAGGLAFGLGGREAAGKYVDKLRSEITHNRE